MTLTPEKEKPPVIGGCQNTIKIITVLLCYHAGKGIARDRIV